jgi:hypothetical protein
MCDTEKGNDIVLSRDGEKSKINVVKKEIESWYMDCISPQGSKTLGIWPPSNTEYINRSNFKIWFQKNSILKPS